MKGGLNVILSFADDAKGKTGNAYYSALFAGWERGEHPILDKGEGRKLSNLTKWFGEKAGEGEEKLEHSSSANRLTGGLGKTAEHVYLGKGLGVGKVGGEADLGVPSPTIRLPTGPFTGVPCFVSRKKGRNGLAENVRGKRGISRHAHFPGLRTHWACSFLGNRGCEPAVVLMFGQGNANPMCQAHFWAGNANPSPCSSLVGIANLKPVLILGGGCEPLAFLQEGRTSQCRRFSRGRGRPLCSSVARSGRRRSAVGGGPGNFRRTRVGWAPRKRGKKNFSNERMKEENATAHHITTRTGPPWAHAFIILGVD